MANSTGMPDDLRRQIEDALDRGHVERLPSDPPPRRSAPRSAPSFPDLRPRSPRDLLLFGGLVALAGWVFRFPFSQEVLFFGLLCVVVAALSFLIRPQGRTQRFWRGRPVDLPPDSWTDQLYRLLYRG
jgi:hypothetical protein